MHANAGAEQEGSCANFEHHRKPEYVCAVSEQRIVALAANMETTRKAGAALPLLLHLCLVCGNGDSCGVMLQDWAKATGVPKPTLKAWMKHLASAGFINKVVAGRSGLRITLLGPLAKPATAVDDMSQLKSAIELIGGAASTVAAVFEKLQNDLGELKGVRP